MSNQQAEIRDTIDALETELLNLRTDVGYAIVQLGPMQTEERVRRALETLAKVQCALADLEVQR